MLDCRKISGLSGYELQKHVRSLILQSVECHRQGLKMITGDPDAVDKGAKEAIQMLMDHHLKHVVL